MIEFVCLGAVSLFAYYVVHIMTKSQVVVPRARGVGFVVFKKSKPQQKPFVEKDIEKGYDDSFKPYEKLLEQKSKEPQDDTDDESEHPFGNF